MKEPSHRARLAAAALVGVLAPHGELCAGEGGTGHVIPGALATLADNAPAAPGGSFAKPMYLHYDGKATAQIPTAAGLAGNLRAKSNTLALAVGHTLETRVLGAAYTAVAALPYTFLDISGDVQTPGGTSVRSLQNSVSGLGDITIIPAMMAWKEGDWQFNALLPIFAPTGSYRVGRLGNPGLNYWTFDPTVGAVYSDAKRGFNALVHAGYAINTENPDTSYRSGNLLHVEGTVQQVLPAGDGLATVGLEAFWFKQMTCDSGAGATLGCFKGRTTGLGPVLGYILPLSKTEQLVFELKWLHEASVTNRLQGDYVWLKAVYKF